MLKWNEKQTKTKEIISKPEPHYRKKLIETFQVIG